MYCEDAQPGALRWGTAQHVIRLYMRRSYPCLSSIQVDPIGLKPKLAMYANTYLLELWLDSPQKDKIFIGSHTLECSPSQKEERYTDVHSGHYDGVHMYGDTGNIAYTESVLNILLTAVQTSSPPDHRQAMKQVSEDFHTRCPQTKYNRSNNPSEKRSYSSVAAGKNAIKTQNRFSPLGN